MPFLLLVDTSIHKFPKFLCLQVWLEYFMLRLLSKKHGHTPALKRQVDAKPKRDRAVKVEAGRKRYGLPETV